MSTSTGLSPHPRLYVGQAELDRLKRTPRRSFLRAAAEDVAEEAEAYCRSTVFDYPHERHNAHLMRARMMQGRIVTLLVRWFQTGDARFREAAVAHVASMGRWEYWSWINWRKKDRRPESIFDLSYGENSATLAIAYDWLFDSLSDEERSLFQDIARKWVVPAFLNATGRKHRQWWPDRADSNWASVCAGGGGLLALAMYEELPQAAKMLSRAERTMTLFMNALTETGGGWSEGIGYWNYGMRYAFMYLLSHERSTRGKHPLLRLRATKATLSFPLDFCPNGVPASFGDSNHWRPLPFHYAAAVRLGCCDVVQVLDHLMLAKFGEREPRLNGRGKGSWPDAAELLCLHPRTRPPAGGRVPAGKRVVKLYRGMDWGILADRMPNPRLYLSVRGGTTEVPHSHRDLMSFNCVIGDEPLVANVNEGEYLDTTFSPRRFELFEMTPASKNTLLINGVGIAGESTVRTQTVRLKGAEGIRIDGTRAFGQMRDGRTARFCGRLFLMLSGRAFLIIDRVELPFTGRVESRLHTYGGVRLTKRGARIKGRKERLRVAYASDVPASLHAAVDAPTTPGRESTMLRWCTDGLYTAVTMATLLSPGAGPARVTLNTTGSHIVAEVKSSTLSRRLTVSKRLRPAGRRVAPRGPVGHAVPRGLPPHAQFELRVAQGHLLLDAHARSLIMHGRPERSLVWTEASRGGSR